MGVDARKDLVPPSIKDHSAAGGEGRYDMSIHVWGHSKESKLLGLSAIDVRPLCAMSSCQRRRHRLLRGVQGVMASSGRWQTACVWECDGEIRPLRSLGDVYHDLSCFQGPARSVCLTTTLTFVFLSPNDRCVCLCACVPGIAYVAVRTNRGTSQSCMFL